MAKGFDERIGSVRRAAPANGGDDDHGAKTPIAGGENFSGG
jgi:hypothetical protein